MYICVHTKEKSENTFLFFLVKQAVSSKISACLGFVFSEK